MDESSENIATMLATLSERDGVSPADGALIKTIATESDTLTVPGIGLEEEASIDPSQGKGQVPHEEDPKVTDLRTQMRDMSIPQKVKLALLGNSVARMLLISDPNRMIQEAVLKNPRLGPTEVEAFAKNTNVSEFVLREISNQKDWMRAYSVKSAIVFNPKTPGDVALRLMRFLNTNELRRLAKSKNVSQLVATTARKRLAEVDKH